MHAGIPPGSRHPPPGAGTPAGAGRHPPDQPPPSRRLLLWTVRILLECILVSVIILFLLIKNRTEKRIDTRVKLKRLILTNRLCVIVTLRKGLAAPSDFWWVKCRLIEGSYWNYMGSNFIPPKIGKFEECYFCFNFPRLWHDIYSFPCKAGHFTRIEKCLHNTGAGFQVCICWCSCMFVLLRADPCCFPKA